MHKKNTSITASQPRHSILIRGQQEAGFSASPEQSVLVAMERAGRALIPVGCRGGGCGQCRIRILNGEYFSKRMSRAWVSPEDEAEGQVLACRVYARSDLTIVPDPPENSMRTQTTD